MTREERYEILESIQDGAYATSYKARDKVLDRMVLLKVLHPRQAFDSDLVQRFRREAMLQARLQHPHIVTIYDFGAEDDFYIASEFVEGVTLEQRLKEQGRMTMDELRPIIQRVTQALSYAHEQGVVHRDLKPANIMIATGGEAKLTDFGLAYARDYSPLTMEGCVVGTPAYMSPEQSRGRRTDARTDVFSLGVVIYQALSGTNPFQSESYADSLNLILNRDPDSLSRLVPDLPAPVCRLVAQMLVKDPEQRPSDLAAVSRVLESGPEIAVVPRRRWPRVAVTIAAGALVLLALVLVTVFRRAAAPSSEPAAAQDSGTVGRPVAQSVLPDSRVAPGLATPDSVKPKTAPTAVVPAGKDLSVRPDSTREPSTPRVVELPVASTEPRHTRLKITVSPWAEVLIDGRSFGVTPLGERLELTQGSHELMLKNPNYPILTRKLALEDTAALLSYDLDHEFAEADIRVQPWALVTIDGQFIDTTPMKRPVALALGPHRITLSHPELGTRTEDVRTDSARLYRFAFNLTQK
jgi:serine/threonine-protein kinase